MELTVIVVFGPSCCDMPALYLLACVCTAKQGCSVDVTSRDDSLD